MSLKELKRYPFLKSSDAHEEFIVRVFATGIGNYGPYIKCEVVSVLGVDIDELSPNPLHADHQDGCSIGITDDVIDALMARGMNLLDEIKDRYLEFGKNEKGYLILKRLMIAANGGEIVPNTPPKKKRSKKEV